MFERLKAWLRGRRDARMQALLFERKVAVRTDEVCITATYPDGNSQSIRWEQVDRITVKTNDSGPWGADVWWLIEGAAAICTYPDGVTGYLEAINELQERFVGFDRDMVGEAMRCTSDKRFVCWMREGAASGHEAF